MSNQTLPDTDLAESYIQWVTNCPIKLAGTEPGHLWSHAKLNRSSEVNRVIATIKHRLGHPETLVNEAFLGGAYDITWQVSEYRTLAIHVGAPRSAKQYWYIDIYDTEIPDGEA